MARTTAGSVAAMSVDSGASRCGDSSGASSLRTATARRPASPWRSGRRGGWRGAGGRSGRRAAAAGPAASRPWPIRPRPAGPAALHDALRLGPVRGQALRLGRGRGRTEERALVAALGRARRWRRPRGSPRARTRGSPSRARPAWRGSGSARGRRAASRRGRGSRRARGSCRRASRPGCGRARRPRADRARRRARSCRNPWRIASGVSDESHRRRTGFRQPAFS